MAKSLRSKVKKRMRAARAAHYWEVKGKARLERITSRLNDPNYDAQKDLCLPPNAFMEPNNPNAVFPQFSKPDIIDFRSNRIADGSRTVVGTFRKNKKPSKYATIVKTREELDEEEKLAKEKEQEEEDQEEDDMIEEVEENVMGVDELANLTANLTIDKKRKKKEQRAAP